MEAYIVIGVGVLCAGSAITGLLKPFEFKTVILDWFTNQSRRLQLVGGIVFLMGAMMLLISLPPQSRDRWVVVVLGFVLLFKGAVATTSPYYRNLHRTIVKILDWYTSKPIIWSIHCIIALVVGILLTAWGIAQL